MKKIAVILANGFEEIEALTVVDVTRRAGFECDMVSISEEYVTGAHNIIVKADKLYSNNINNYDMIVFPGGLPGAENLAKDERVIKAVKEFNDNENKYIAAICASPAMILSAAGIEKDRFITAYPGEDFENMLEEANYVEELVVVDKNLITSRGPATSLLFAYKIIDILGKDSENLKQGMLWNEVEEEKN